MQERFGDTPKLPTVECNVCSNTIRAKDEHAYMQVPCDHIYCCDCLRQLFDTALTTESSFPPRCCPDAEIELARGQGMSDVAHDLRLANILGPARFEKYIDKRKEKRLELAISVQDRRYCAAPGCSAFIPPRLIVGNIAMCPKCDTTTCVQCKAVSHEGSCQVEVDEEEDPEMKKLVEQEGWKACTGCGRTISRIDGCNHMT